MLVFCITYQHKSAIAALYISAVLRFDAGISFENINASGTASLPPKTPLSSVAKGPLAFTRYEHTYMATELSIMVVMTSLTFSLTFNTAGIQA